MVLLFISIFLNLYMWSKGQVKDLHGTFRAGENLPVSSEGIGFIPQDHVFIWYQESPKIILKGNYEKTTNPYIYRLIFDESGEEQYIYCAKDYVDILGETMKRYPRISDSPMFPFPSEDIPLDGR